MRTISILSLLIFSTSISAQVTIGSRQKHMPGALLDLKEEGQTARGLGLPRVGLINLNDLYPCVEDMAADPGSKVAHVGLVVYNTSEQAPKPKDPCDPFPKLDVRLKPGLMVWDGEEWANLTDQSDEEVRDPSWLHPAVKFLTDVDGNKYTYRKFGNAGTWMTENFRGKSYSTNTRGYDPNQSMYCAPSDLPAGETDACFSYPSPPREDGTYPPYNQRTAFDERPNLGLRYNWAASTNSIVPATDGEFIQGICPDGWHIPWNFEFEALFLEVAANKNEYANKDIAGQVAPSRYGLTPCLPYFPYDIQAGASLMAIEGGLALLWNGSHSLDISKEYGELAVYIALKWTAPNKCYSNANIRNVYEENDWRYYSGQTRWQYSLRCKKDVDD